tara:strand:+ start:144 stop:1367 length:1224 start_codon:yes stop_codon:yes gene_type:complete
MTNIPPNKTVATIPIKENNAQYYQGQEIVPQNGGQNYSFPNFNTTLVSAYDTAGTQIASASNFKLYDLATATTTPVDTGLPGANQIPEANIAVTNTTNNTVRLNAPIANNFLCILVQQPALGYNYGSYSLLSLDDIINNFIVAFTGADQILNNVKRNNILFHARRAVQEFSYDTLPAIKTMELTVPDNLNLPLPQDYVNYVRVARVDAAGVLHTILPLNGLSGNPTEMPLQDSNGIPTQDAFSENQEGTSIVEDRWKKATTNEITGNYDAYEPTGVYDFTWWKQVYGQRYGLNPEISNENGWFSINQRLGTLSFSSNFKGLCVLVNYITDGLGDDMNPVIPKMAEDAIYANMLYNICRNRRDVDGGTKQFYKRDAYAKTRNAKIRLQNLKLDELTQVFRGQSKWIKH